jgi:TetR/AcrR family transcriptional regulator
MSAEETVVRRMNGEDRRESILSAATAVFGAKGYAGATTDDVAKAAGVSQPYVVRLFGSKSELFLAVLDRAVGLMTAAFRSAIDGDPEEKSGRMGRAYVGLISERGLLQTVSAAFLLGGDPVIGPSARTQFIEVWRLLREEAGFDAEQTRSFFADGMLINTIIGLRLVNEEGDPSVDELFAACLPEGAELVLKGVPTGTDRW